MMLKSVTVVVVLWSFFGCAYAQTCEQVASMSRMARATSLRALMKEKQAAGDSYRAQLIFASRAFGLDPNDAKAAARILDLIPKNDAQQLVWLNLGGPLCDGESMGEMRILGRLRDSLPSVLARAVLIAPDKMQAYVSYAIEANQDPHSDYAVQMRSVCEVRHPAFQKAVNELPPEKRAWFEKHILDPVGCRVRALPEAE